MTIDKKWVSDDMTTDEELSAKTFSVTGFRTSLASNNSNTTWSIYYQLTFEAPTTGNYYINWGAEGYPSGNGILCNVGLTIDGTMVYNTTRSGKAQWDYFEVNKLKEHHFTEGIHTIRIEHKVSMPASGVSYLRDCYIKVEKK